MADFSQQPRIPTNCPNHTARTYVFNCLTKLEKLLCLKCSGSKSLANSAGLQTTKLRSKHAYMHYIHVLSTLATTYASYRTIQPQTDETRSTLAYVVQPHLCPSAPQETTASVSFSSTRSYLHGSRHIMHYIHKPHIPCIFKHASVDIDSTLSKTRIRVPRTFSPRREATATHGLY